MNKLMIVSEYRDVRFAGTKKPSINTIKRWVENGSIPGKKIGGLYYVDITAESEQTGNTLADMILSAT